MSDWVVSNITNDEEVSSIIPNRPASSGDNIVPNNNESNVQTPQYQTQQPFVEPNQIPENEEQEEVSPITSLGSSYQIKDVTVKKAGLPMPSWLISAIVIIPLIAIFVMSALSNRENNKPEESFLFKTLESKYFSLNYSPDYEATSVVDKKVPFVEKHDLVSNIDGEKYIRIMVKDVKFDYTLDNNANVKARRDNRDLYVEEKYELNYKEGLYFKKRSENFEHLILLVDRGKSVLYEIIIESTSNFANDEEMLAEVNEMLESVTFL